MSKKGQTGEGNEEKPGQTGSCYEERGLWSKCKPKNSPPAKFNTHNWNPQSLPN